MPQALNHKRTKTNVPLAEDKSPSKTDQGRAKAVSAISITSLWDSQQGVANTRLQQQDRIKKLALGSALPADKGNISTIHTAQGSYFVHTHRGPLLVMTNRIFLKAFNCFTSCQVEVLLLRVLSKKNLPGWMLTLEVVAAE